MVRATLLDTPVPAPPVGGPLDSASWWDPQERFDATEGNVKETLERVLLALNILLICLLGFLAFRAGGPGRVAVATWAAERRVASTLRTRWPDVSAAGNRVDSMGAAVRLVEFADYQCPFCRQAHPALEKLMRENPTIGVAYIQFPLPGHSAARGAARAALCAASQGRFLAMHRRLYETTAWQADTDWTREATAARIPHLDRFAACIQDPSTDRRIDSSVALANRLGVDATPTFFSSRARLRGYPEGGALARLAGGR